MTGVLCLNERLHTLTSVRPYLRQVVPQIIQGISDPGQYIQQVVTRGVV